MAKKRPETTTPGLSPALLDKVKEIITKYLETHQQATFVQLARAIRGSRKTDNIAITNAQIVSAIEKSVKDGIIMAHGNSFMLPISQAVPGTSEVEHVIIRGKKYFLDKAGALSLVGLKISSIEEIEGLKSLRHLKELDLGNNILKNVDGLDHLVELEALSLYGSHLESTKGLDALPNLQILNLRGNNISRIEGLLSSRNLRVLYLDYNKIEKIEGLDSLTRLEILDLGHNRIRKLEGLDSLVNLRELVLEFNRIKKIEGLDRLSNLDLLVLHYNDIDYIGGLEHLHKLRGLHILGNLILDTRIDQPAFRALPNLDDIEIDDNPRLDPHPDDE